jgi:hypothetical protein
VYRLLGRVIALLLIAGVATAAIMGRETRPTAFGRWLGFSGTTTLVPGGLTLEAPVVGDIIDAGARQVLAIDADRAAAFATYLANRGAPPSHAADVRALTENLGAFAVAARSLSTCSQSCRGAAIALDAEGVDILRLVLRLHAATRQRRF